MLKIGIIGNAADKFTLDGKQLAIQEINSILDTFAANDILVSGGCPLGGVDIWAEEQALQRSIKTDIKRPKQHKWDAIYGFKQRNIDIAKESNRLYIILADNYPANYTGMRFNICYHCGSTSHVKSGACWTAKRAKEFGNEVLYRIIHQP